MPIVSSEKLGQESHPNKQRKLVIHTDGGSRGNPGPAACACVIEEVAGKVRVLRGKYLGRATNNIAEFQGVILAFEEVGKIPMLNLSRLNLDFYLDSKLVASQLNGVFRVKDKNIREVIVKIRGLENKFSQIYYHHIPREENKLADKIVNETLDRYL